jgi:hypothetical protein
LLLSQWTAACLPRSTTKTPSLLIGLQPEEKKTTRGRIRQQPGGDSRATENEQGIGRKALRQKLVQNI